MPVIQESTINIPGSTFQFSAIRPEHLGASEYTLVTVVVDSTGSVATFADELLKMLKETINSCKKSPRAENLLVRVVSFNTRINEIHGFRPLPDIKIDDYAPFRPMDATALYDAVYSSVEATTTYSKTLMEQDFLANGIVFVITDGDDNRSVSTANMIKNAIDKAKSEEVIESLNVVLIGINAQDAHMAGRLNMFAQDVGINQFVEVKDAHPAKLAKLAGFISKSISSTSQALGTGGPSQPLTF